MKKIISWLLACLVLAAMSPAASAHSGRTDARGGHKDNKNASGLGSYHYHCGGYPAHLHPNGVCPYKSGGASAGRSSGNASSSTGTGGTASNASQAVKTTDWDDRLVAQAERKLAELKAAGQTSGSLGVAEAGEIDLATSKEIARLAKACGIELTLQCSSRIGNDYLLRLDFRPAGATGRMAVGAAFGTDSCNKVQERFEGLFSNSLAVVELAQQGAYGTEVEIALDTALTPLDADTLCLYQYDPQTGKNRRIEEDNWRIDGNGYLRFATSEGGYLVLSDGALARR